VTNWPDWWSWKIEILPHVYDRMLDRDFSETDLRLMLEDVVNIQKNHEPGRWVVTTRFRNAQWRIIVEPDPEDRILIVVTVYPVY
jgi:hypothetical protein